MQSTRRHFLKSTLFVGSAALLLSACDDDASDYPPAGGDGGLADAGGARGLLTTVASNHGHVLLVPVSDLWAGAAVTYDIAGTSGHSHWVTLAEGDWSSLREYGSLTLESTDAGGHSHSVMVIY